MENPAELPNLTTLYLWTNNISDLSVLPLLPKLELLDLNGNHIRDVSRLAGFTNLATLMLRGNKISDVSPLTGLVNLEALDDPVAAAAPPLGETVIFLDPELLATHLSFEIG